MSRRRKSVNILKGVMGVLSVTILFYCSDNNDAVLARVGNMEIKADAYMKRLKKVREKLSLPDNGEVRINFLNSWIDEKLLLTETERLGYHDDAAALDKLALIKLQNILDMYLEGEVYGTIKITDDDLKRHFTKMNIKLKVRHLYADNRATADSLYMLVKNGAAFEELALQVFHDPRLRETGGDLGYMGIDEMQMDFADAAYALEIGDVSGPVKTNYGYSIIKVEDRLGNPFLTETEFLKQKSAVATSYEKYAKKRAARDHAAALQTEIRFNQPVFEKLYLELKPAFASNDLLEGISKNSSLSEDDLLLNCALGDWDIQTFKDKAKFTSAEQREWIRSRDFFKEFITGLVSRDMIIELAKDKGYDESDAYTEAVEKEFDQYKIDRLKEDILNSISTPQDSLQAFYQRYKVNLIEPSMANLREIVLDNQQTALKVKQAIAAGVSFSDLARQYSLNKHTAVFGGEMGFIKYSEFGPYVEQVKNMKPGDWTGPLKRGSIYFFLQCIEQRPKRIKTFDEARQEVVSKYKSMHFADAMQDKIEEIRTHTVVASYPDRLKDLKYN